MCYSKHFKSGAQIPNIHYFRHFVCPVFDLADYVFEYQSQNIHFLSVHSKTRNKCTIKKPGLVRILNVNFFSIFKVRVFARHRADLQKLSAVQRRKVRVHHESKETGKTFFLNLGTAGAQKLSIRIVFGL